MSARLTERDRNTLSHLTSIALDIITSMTRLLCNPLHDNDLDWLIAASDEITTELREIHNRLN